MSSLHVAASLPPPPAVSAPRPTPAPRVWAGGVVLLAALGLVLLGGCFLLGVLTLLRGDLSPQAQPVGPLSGAETFLLYTLYTLAFACFAAAVVLAVLGVRGLLAVLYDRRAAG